MTLLVPVLDLWPKKHNPSIHNLNPYRRVTHKIPGILYISIDENTNLIINNANLGRMVRW